jgi:hypothetical protein
VGIAHLLIAGRLSAENKKWIIPNSQYLMHSARPMTRKEQTTMHPFWIATHDPHDPDDRWQIYLKEQKRAGGLPSLGHKVLFYETENVSSGGLKGRKALVCAAEIVGRLQERRPPKGEWRYEIPCSEPQIATRTVSRDEMLSALGLKLSTPLFTWRGLKNISEPEYLKFRQMMGL